MRGYSREDWQNLSRAKRYRIYRARDRLETARIVAAMLRDPVEGLSITVVSALTPKVNNTGNNNATGGREANATQRGVAQISLATIGQAMNRRQSNIGAYNSGHRKIMQVDITTRDNTFSEVCRTELDSHADTCGVNDVAYILEHHGKVAEVHGFSKSLQSMQNIPIVKAALAYDIPETGETIILVINEALYFGNQLNNILLNQNQMRTHGLIVNDCPRHLSKGKSTHSIKVEEQDICIPLKLYGIISYFDMQRPTKDEVYNCQHDELTSCIEWEPYAAHFVEEETKHDSGISLLASVKVNSLNIHHDDCHDTIVQKINQVAVTKAAKSDLLGNSETLARRWMVGDKIAQATIKATTQSFIRSAIHPIERRFRTKVATLHYDQVKCRFYSDTFFSSETSVINNTYGQMFITNFGFVKFVPLKTKAEAPIVLMEIIQNV